MAFYMHLPSTTALDETTNNTEKTELLRGDRGMRLGGGLTVCCGQTIHRTTYFISSILNP